MSGDAWTRTSKGQDEVWRESTNEREEYEIPARGGKESTRCDRLKQS